MKSLKAQKKTQGKCARRKNKIDFSVPFLAVTVISDGCSQKQHGMEKYCVFVFNSLSFPFFKCDTFYGNTYEHVIEGTFFTELLTVVAPPLPLLSTETEPSLLRFPNV